MAVSGKLTVRVEIAETKTIDPGRSGSVPLVREYSWSFANGTGAEQANLLWTDERSLATGANEDIDVAASLVNAYGDAAVFAKVKAIIIFAKAANTTILTVSRPATSGLPFLDTDGDAFKLGPGDFCVFTRRAAAGIAVSAGADDVINILNAAGATATYEILILGTDA